jgi:aerobic-type carbon monoxide dehydrogenase small subunit (CoxS/CutS family)
MSAGGAPTIPIHCTINGETVNLEVRPNETLLDALRAAGYWGVKRGCETGDCGSCTVLHGKAAVNACVTLAAQADGWEITTVEALAADGELHPLQESFLDHSAVQCGYCIPGMLLTAKALLDEVELPTEAEIREALAGSLCRCTGYVKPVEAILAVVEERRRRGGPAGAGGTKR